VNRDQERDSALYENIEKLRTDLLNAMHVDNVGLCEVKNIYKCVLEPGVCVSILIIIRMIQWKADAECVDAQAGRVPHYADARNGPEACGNGCYLEPLVVL
jgi:hypothetical protein